MRPIAIKASFPKAGGTFLRPLSYIVVVLAAILFASEYHFVSTALLADGKVVAMDRVLRSRAGWRYYPVYSFHDANGVEHRIREAMGANPPSHVIGDEVALLYPPNHPEYARLDSFDSRWGGPFRLLALALLCRALAFVKAGKIKAPWREQVVWS